MLITDKFVLLNFPKTGSTFVRNCLKQIHRQSPVQRLLRRSPEIQELLLPNIRYTRDWGRPDQHGTREQIPVEHRHKPVVTVIRNPLDRLVSLYEFRNWQRQPPEQPSFYKAFPQFPNLSFTDYVAFVDWHIENELPVSRPPANVGVQSIQFVQFYFWESTRTLARLTDEYIDSGCWREEIGDITFLHQENLNRELHAFLRGCGYIPEQIDFILDAPPANVTRERGDWSEYYTPGLLQKMRRRERLLLKVGGYE